MQTAQIANLTALPINYRVDGGAMATIPPNGIAYPGVYYDASEILLWNPNEKYVIDMAAANRYLDPDSQHDFIIYLAEYLTTTPSAMGNAALFINFNTGDSLFCYGPSNVAMGNVPHLVNHITKPGIRSFLKSQVPTVDFNVKDTIEEGLAASNKICLTIWLFCIILILAMVGVVAIVHWFYRKFTE